MEVPGGKNRKMTVSIYEMLGTALFVYGILTSEGNAIAVPLSLFASIIIFGGITGGHFNPAVSLGCFVALADWNLGNILLLGMMIVAQCLGAILAIGMAWLSLILKDGDEVFLETPPYVCPVDVTDVVKDGKLTEKTDCDNTDG